LETDEFGDVDLGCYVLLKWVIKEVDLRM